ncbi:MAG: DNA gyrase subunit A [Tissierellia bacterium]|nr:DNA gyrase subunit A [Tissierellia bacterium]
MDNLDKQKIVIKDIEHEMKESYLDYAMSVIVSRALPDVRDGLKPVHRRIIYGMYKLGVTPDKAYRKSAKLVGDVMGSFHPHGDSAIYDALVRLAQDFSTRYPLADGQGNFGSIDGDGAAAMRYTEVRMSKLTQEMVRDIHKETVDFQPNFDESEEEPIVLPSRFPNLLVNGSSGIAVGMATNMAPHNLREIISGISATIDNPQITIDELSEIIKGPDFPTGGKIMGRQPVLDAYHTGRGRVILRAEAEIEEYKNRHRIVISEIPYQVNKSNLIIKIVDLVKDKRIEGISDIRDESDRKGMRIVVELKRDANPQVILNLLYQYTQMQTTFGIINLALVNGEPKVLNLRQLIDLYIEHQVEVITRRTQFDLDKAQARAHIIEGLLKALDNIDEIIAIIRSSDDDTESKRRFTESFGLTDTQGQAILIMQLRRLQKLEKDKLQNEYEELIKEIARLTEILSNPRVLLNLIKTELEEIKEKYGDMRRTRLVPAATEINMEDMIHKEDVIITLTQSGYIKRMPEGTYRPQRRGGRGITALTTKEEDVVKDIFITSTHDTILFFTNSGKVFSLKAYEIPEGSRTARGMAIVNLLNLQSEEYISGIIPIAEQKPGQALIMVTNTGIIKKTELQEYDNIRKNGIIGITLREGEHLIDVRLLDEEQDVIIVSQKGKAIRFNTEEVRSMGRTARGVKAMTLDEDDMVVSMERVEENMYLLVISEQGFGKLTSVEEYRTQSRGGKGMSTYNIREKTGPLVGAKVLDTMDEIMLINEQGIIIRLEVADISIMGRNTQGVKVMNIKDGKIVSIAKYIGE